MAKEYINTENQIKDLKKLYSNTHTIVVGKIVELEILDNKTMKGNLKLEDEELQKVVFNISDKKNREILVKNSFQTGFFVLSPKGVCETVLFSESPEDTLIH